MTTKLKCTKLNNMTKTAEDLKFTVYSILEKQGVALEDVEYALEKYSGTGDNTTKGIAALYGLLKIYGGAAAMAGAAGGIGAYGAGTLIENSGDKIDDQERKIQKIRDANQQLKAIHAQQQGLI